jgi:hypothetical protein
MLCAPRYCKRRAVVTGICRATAVTLTRALGGVTYFVVATSKQHLFTLTYLGLVMNDLLHDTVLQSNSLMVKLNYFISSLSCGLPTLSVTS